MNDSIASGTRTVVGVAALFASLQETARALAASGSAEQRGYFTPSESEAALGLLASYWQARNALGDLLLEFRAEEVPYDERPEAFLVAFAAALLLIDAARFLRETLHERPVARTKLNEPAAEFGIPPDVYDTVQASLLRARNAWHLYFADDFFRKHEPTLRERSVRPELAPVWAIVERLRGRLEVPLARFARGKLRTRAAQIYRWFVQQTFGRALYGLCRFAGEMAAEKYVRWGHRPGLPRAVYDELRRLLRPGDVLAVRKEYAITNYFLPGYWPHVALVLGDATELARLGVDAHEHVQARWPQLASSAGDSLRVLEAMRDGVLIRPLGSPFRSDSVVVLRPRLPEEEIGRALARGLAHEGKPYDFEFDFRRSDRLVCTEVVYRSYDGVGGLSFALTPRAGRPTLSGSDLIRLAARGECFAPVAAYAPLLTPHIVHGNEVQTLLERGLERG